MRARVAWLIGLSVLFILLCSSCKKELKDFSFSYTMESVGNYKLQVFFNGNGTYRIEEYNSAMGSAVPKREPIIKSGALTDEELIEVKRLISDSNLPEMKDYYGFDKESNAGMGDILYQVSFITVDNEKLITICNSDNKQFTGSFVRLIGYINSFLNTHK
ncbi:MAG: hypothetical protein RR382_10400 [Tannerellaceae bacterium]